MVSLGSSIPPSHQLSVLSSSRSSHSTVSSIEDECKICYADRGIDYYVCGCRGTQGNICWNCLRTLLINRLDSEDFDICRDCGQQYIGIEFVFEPRSLLRFNVGQFCVFIGINNLGELQSFLIACLFGSFYISGILMWMISQFMGRHMTGYHYLTSVAIIWLLIIFYILFRIPAYLRSEPTTPVNFRLNLNIAIPK